MILYTFLRIVFAIHMAAMLVVVVGQTRRPSADLTFCQFELSDNIKQPHIDFTEAYIFRIGPEGAPAKISRVLGNILNVDAVYRCMSNWRFRGLPKNSALTAYFRWENGMGWTQLRVVSKQFSQTIRTDSKR